MEWDPCTWTYMFGQNIISIEKKDLEVSPEKHQVRIIRPKLEYACTEIRKKQRIATKMVPDLEDLTWEKNKINAPNNTKRKKRKKRLNYNIWIDEQPGENG